jgi:hypothetical protein
MWDPGINRFGPAAESSSLKRKSEKPSDAGRPPWPSPDPDFPRSSLFMARGSRLTSGDIGGRFATTAYPSTSGHPSDSFPPKRRVDREVELPSLVRAWIDERGCRLLRLLSCDTGCIEHSWRRAVTVSRRLIDNAIWIVFCVGLLVMTTAAANGWAESSTRAARIGRVGRA